MTLQWSFSQKCVCLSLGSLALLPSLFVSGCGGSGESGLKVGADFLTPGRSLSLAALSPVLPLIRQSPPCQLAWPLRASLQLRFVSKIKVFSQLGGTNRDLAGHGEDRSFKW